MACPWFGDIVNGREVWGGSLLPSQITASTNSCTPCHGPVVVCTGVCPAVSCACCPPSSPDLPSMAWWVCPPQSECSSPWLGWIQRWSMHGLVLVFAHSKPQQIWDQDIPGCRKRGASTAVAFSMRFPPEAEGELFTHSPITSAGNVSVWLFARQRLWCLASRTDHPDIHLGAT